MAINYAPKVGEVLECNFGDYLLDPETNEADRNNFHGKVPPEMRKHRMVVVMNGKLGGSCVVVPISSSKDQGLISRGLHIPLDTGHFRVTDFYDRRDRWAKVETMQHVSKARLFKMRDRNGRFDQHLPFEVVEEIQKAIVRLVAGSKLLAK
ncbi:MAG: type II toxin-antitoxin system PemK/MazF family toxin [Pseudomonadota bacterium]|nr:type II toxin-antitoxin system PemK/MazF family toxin [Pseudomonadota bacterium]